jgi:hypothetical protein
VTRLGRYFDIKNGQVLSEKAVFMGISFLGYGLNEGYLLPCHGTKLFYGPIYL